MNVKKLIAFTVFSSVSCMVAMASLLWGRVRRFVHDMSLIEPAVRKRYGDI